MGGKTRELGHPLRRVPVSDLIAMTHCTCCGVSEQVHALGTHAPRCEDVVRLRRLAELVVEARGARDSQQTRKATADGAPAYGALSPVQPRHLGRLAHVATHSDARIALRRTVETPSNPVALVLTHFLSRP